MADPIVYLELPAPDLSRLEAFYAAVFGWKVARSDLEAGVAYASFDAGSLQGGLDPSLAVTPRGGPLLYVKVADLAGTLRAIEAAGGEVERPPHPVGGAHGYSARFKDPCGNHLGLWSSAP